MIVLYYPFTHSELTGLMAWLLLLTSLVKDYISSLVPHTLYQCPSHDILTYAYSFMIIDCNLIVSWPPNLYKIYVILLKTISNKSSLCNTMLFPPEDPVNLCTYLHWAWGSLTYSNWPSIEIRPCDRMKSSFRFYWNAFFAVSTYI